MSKNLKASGPGSNISVHYEPELSSLLCFDYEQQLHKSERVLVFQVKYIQQ